MITVARTADSTVSTSVAMIESDDPMPSWVSSPLCVSAAGMALRLLVSRTSAAFASPTQSGSVPPTYFWRRRSPGPGLPALSTVSSSVHGPHLPVLSWTRR